MVIEDYNTEKKYRTLMTDCINPVFGKFRCRRCANCLSARSREWTARLMQETQKSFHVVAFCLTYTDKQLNDLQCGASPFAEVDTERGKAFQFKYRDLDGYQGIPVLSKRDIQLFVKRLRKSLSTYDKEARVKYFVKGEYGDVNYRPHYHGLIFVEKGNINETTLKLCILKSWYNGMFKERGKAVDKTHPWNWNKKLKENPIVEFEDFGENCAKYTTKYTCKESIKDIKASHLIDEFTLQSQKLGVEYFIKQIEKKRKEFKALSEQITGEEEQNFLQIFEKHFERIFTFSSIGNELCYFPKYLKTTFFGGYYVYPQQVDKEAKGRSYKSAGQTKFIEINKTNKDEGTKNWLGDQADQRLYDIYVQLLYEYSQNKMQKWLKEHGQQLDSLLSRHTERVTINNTNRLVKAKEHRDKNVAKRKNYAKNG